MKSESEEGGLERGALAALEGVDSAHVERFLRAVRGEPDDAFSVERVARTSTAVLIGEWDEVSCVNCAVERRDAADAIGVVSIVIVPLVAHGRTLGALALGSLTRDATFGAAELGSRRTWHIERPCRSTPSSRMRQHARPTA